MDGKEEDRNGFDPTKEAFFSDMNEVEEEIASDAYQIVEHALSLIRSKQFDDSIELLRQAIGLYEQINRKAEVEALHEKLNEVHLMKENDFIEKQKEETESLELTGEINKLILDDKNGDNSIQRGSDIEEEDEEEFIKKRKREQKEQEIRRELNKLVKSAEKIARNYGIEFKKAVKQGTIEFESKYPEVIDMFNKARKIALSSGWVNDAKIYSTHIRKYTELLEKERRVREIEERKIKEKLQFEEMKKTTVTMPSKRDEEIIAQQRKNEQRENEIRESIDSLVKRAEKIARDYQIEFKKAVKHGNLDIESKYPEVIDIYLQVKEKALKNGWEKEAMIYSTQVRKYNDFYEKEKKIRLLEAQKVKEEEEFKKLQKIGQKDLTIQIDDVDRKELIERNQIEKEEKDKRDNIENLIKSAEKMVRDYELKFKKAVKNGNLDLKSKYPEIIELYTRARKIALSSGWETEAKIYSTHIRKCKEAYEREKKIRELEAEKAQKDREFEEMLKKKEKVGSEIDMYVREKAIEKQTNQEEQQKKQLIEKLLSSAQKIARDYEIEFKKAIKRGTLDIESKYPKVIEMLTQAKNTALNYGWETDAKVCSTQIRLYTQLMEKEQRVRKIEEKKRKEKRQFEEMKKFTRSEPTKKKLQETNKEQEEEKIFEAYIDKIVDEIEKEAREYEFAIKRGKFEKECPYLNLSKKYEDLYKQVLQKGWRNEAKIYSNQANIYREKYEKDEYLRKLESEKSEKQKEYHEALRSRKEIESKIPKLQELEKKDDSDILIDNAMNLITQAESEVRSYELSIKKDILIIESPYENAISKYEQAREIFKDVGWNDEAKRLLTTINFYKEKKEKDDNLRKLEQERQTQKKERIEVKPVKQKPILREIFVSEMEEKKLKKKKEAEHILNLIQKAEKKSKEYNQEIKAGILKVECPYQEIISMYSKAKEEFEKIGWKEQANQIVDSISYYQEKLAADIKLRNLEKEKQIKEEKLLERRKLEAQIARKAEDELLKQKTRALELKKQKAREYEAKKEQAFELMDKAKKELKFNNFDVAIKYYLESEKIFEQINWNEGKNMVSKSINIIKKKEEKLKRELKLQKQKEEEEKRFKQQIEKEIIEAEELKKMQEEQKRREFLKIQKQKEKEQSISIEAYKLLEDGTALKDKKQFDQAYKKYIMARDLFNKIEWTHEVSRINNDLLFLLKKEMKQEDKMKAFQQKKVEEEKELEALLREAEVRRVELEKNRKEEKRLKREQMIQKEWEKANSIIKDLRYNEAIVILKNVLKKLKKINKDKLVKQLEKQFETLQNASQIPLIALIDLEKGERLDKVRNAYNALDNAQISISTNLIMRAISELEEAKYNLKDTIIGQRVSNLIDEKIKNLKKDFKTDGDKVIEPKKTTIEEDDLRSRIAARRAERRRKIKELLEDEKK